jgi:ribosome recycling factor
LRRRAHRDGRAEEIVVSRYLQDGKKGMEKALEHLKGELARLRVGRASAAMLELVRVEAYGNEVGIKEVAALGVPDAKTLTVQPWDKGLFAAIEKGILAANLGLTPINDGKIIRINMPPMTEDRRKDFVKQIKKLGEEAKVAVRNARRDALDSARRNKDQDGATDDSLRGLEKEVQKVTDQIVAEIDKLVDGKSKEVMTL